MTKYFNVRSPLSLQHTRNALEAFEIEKKKKVKYILSTQTLISFDFNTLFAAKALFFSTRLRLYLSNALCPIARSVGKQHKPLLRNVAHLGCLIITKRCKHMKQHCMSLANYVTHANSP